jgi:pyrrolysine biosynthesis protein PylC
MKRVVVIGGKLQGTEACYLARKAGYVSVLVDKRAGTPASGLADETFVCDVRSGAPDASGPLAGSLRSADLVLPALEDADALDAIARLAERFDAPLAFDADAYRITSSKLLSDALIRRLGIPSPDHAGDGGRAGGGADSGDGWIVKPSHGSGSAGVRRFATLGEARAYAAEREDAEGFIIQRYLEGPSYSVEVVGRPGRYRSYEITEIHVDDEWDCRLVTAPCALAPGLEAGLRDAALRLAEGVGLHGIMDAEAILHGGEMKLLEIDARIPSQTPAVVLASTGMNLLAELTELAGGGFGVSAPCARKFASYENILASEGGVFSLGEHIMGKAGPLTLREGFLGADESMTDYSEGCEEFRGIFINSADTAAELAEKRARMYETIRGHV